MKISEAMMLGSFSIGQVIGVFKSPNGACALGTVGHAIGEDSYIGVEKAYPWIVSENARCPECSVLSTVENIIVHLNDCHIWGREEIADWLGSVEPSDPVATQTEGRVPVCTETAKVAV